MLEIAQLTDLLAKHQADFDEMNAQHDIKLKELEEIRLRSNEEIKRLSQIQAQAQTDLNVLLVETQKYESQVEFLMSERSMIA